MKTKSKNENVLQGIRCPECGQEDRFCITAAVVLTVTDDGSEASGEQEWDSQSWTLCPECEFADILASFETDDAEVLYTCGDQPFTCPQCGSRTEGAYTEGAAQWTEFCASCNKTFDVCNDEEDE